MPSANDIERLLLLDAILIKASGYDTGTLFLNLERRLQRAISNAFTDAAAPAVDNAVRASTAGKSPTQVTTKLGEMISGWQDGVRAPLLAVLRQGVLEAKRQILLRAAGKLAPIRKAEAELTPTFTLADERAVEQLVEGQLHWMGEFYSDELAEEIDALVQDVMVNRGLGRAEAGKLLEQVLRAKLGLTAADIPPGWGHSAEAYWEMLASNSVTNARVRGSLLQMGELRLPTYTIVAIGDERTCKRCRFMDGKVFPYSLADETMGKIGAARKPEDIKSAHPWASNVKQMENDPEMFPFPPFHGRCRCTVDISDDAELTFD